MKERDNMKDVGLDRRIISNGVISNMFKRSVCIVLAQQSRNDVFI
jgi:hypothetical protein